MADIEYAKKIKPGALAMLLKDTRGMHPRRWQMVLDSLAQYVLYGDMEAPGANMVPFENDEDIPRDAVDSFCKFLVANGESCVNAEAEMDRGLSEMEYTVGMDLS